MGTDWSSFYLRIDNYYALGNPVVTHKRATPVKGIRGVEHSSLVSVSLFIDGKCESVIKLPKVVRIVLLRR